MIGFTRGTFLQADKGHQCTYDQPFESHLARSTDGGESWTTWHPSGYAGNLNSAEPRPLRNGLDFSGEGFVLRAEGAGYHGNRAARWFHSDDRGASWHGPHAFTGLLDHPELAGKEFTARTSYVVDGPNELSLFLTVRRRKEPHELGISLQEKTFLARTDDGGATFSFVAWAVPWDDPYRAAMPAPARLSPTRLITAARRKSAEHNWIDCFYSDDDGATWSFLSEITRTEVGNEWNGNPPSLVRMSDGRLCAVYGNRTDRQMQARYSGDDGATWSAPQVLRDGFRSANGFPDLGYAQAVPAPGRPAGDHLLLVHRRAAADPHRRNHLPRSRTVGLFASESRSSAAQPGLRSLMPSPSSLARMADSDNNHYSMGSSEMNAVFAVAARLQELVPDAVLVGGTAAVQHAGAVHHAGHRVSLDDDHVVADLRERFDDVLAALEETSGWVTARVQRPVLILGRLDGVETGVRNLIRRTPLEVEVVVVGNRDLRVPTLPEIARIKAWLCLLRNATRDYLDFAALADRLGDRRTAAVVAAMDRYYADQLGADGRRVATQVARQLAEPRPDDLGEVDLISYRRLDRRWHDWQTVVDVCRRVAVQVLDRLVEEAE